MQFTERSIATIKRYEMDIDVELVFLKCLQRTIQMWLRWGVLCYCYQCLVCSNLSDQHPTSNMICVQKCKYLYHNDAKQFSKKIDFAQYGKNTVKLLQYDELLVKLLQIWCQVLKDC